MMVVRKATGLLLAVAVGSLAGCGATKYRTHRGWKGGFTDARLSEDTFKVSFVSNAFTPRATAEIYILYRCAEVVVAAGYDHFQITGTSGNWTPWSPDRPFPVLPQSALAAEHRAHHPAGEYGALVRASKGERPEGAYDARQLLQFLAPSIRR